MVITINGTPGSGKSTVAKKLAKKLNWPKFYGGNIRRMRAKSMGLTLAEYNKLGEQDARTDFEVDNYLKQAAKKHRNCVIESRTAWHLIPDSIKIYIDVDEKIGAQRVFAELKKHNKRNEDKNLHSVKEVLKSHKQRKLSDYKRYKKYYHFNLYNKNNYDFILDTTDLNKKQVFDQVYNYLKNRLPRVRVN
ncbi:cytidylate kinase family protein [Patescibacteria group bacterium]|nr:cytidylate kinase family protein [Patescibacteria group bacterium]MBU1663138.1 cytidylate kinase family protein [Patescibacteria group bacterium]MBU1933666.1 cytidylate kinase family protein [Patescibacteria group bacterium]MBU2008123.1 cytidylate kinase family protein [Patescibacteria group bacterium]MBU2233468.1 cytidylate kinase family protein [Patescibacteria group bacterium]